MDELAKKDKIEKRQSNRFKIEGKPTMARSKMKAIKKEVKKLEIDEDQRDRLTYLGTLDDEEDPTALSKKKKWVTFNKQEITFKHKFK